MVHINTTQPIYNGYSIRYILAHLPRNMAKVHRKLYIQNCIEVYRSEKAKMNLGYAECIRNSNHFLITFYRSQPDFNN